MVETYKTRIGPEKSTSTGKIRSVGWKKNLILIRSGKPFTSNKRPEKESGKPNRRKDQHTRCAYIMQRSRKYAWVARLLIRNHARTPACAKMDRWRAERRAVPRVGFFFAFFFLCFIRFSLVFSFHFFSVFLFLRFLYVRDTKFTYVYKSLYKLKHKLFIRVYKVRIHAYKVRLRVYTNFVYVMCFLVFFIFNYVRM